MAIIDVLPTPAVAAPVWDEIWALTRAYYDTDRGYAEERLKEHQRVALLRSGGSGALIGMASIDVYPAVFRGRPLAVIFTSHVLLREEHRGQNLIQQLGLRTYLGARLRYPLRPIYWFFDTFSCKSYLLLARNAREYWPRHDRPTPQWESALMAQLAERTYGAAWQPALGIVSRSGRKRLRAGTAPLAADLAGQPELAFFARANPGHAEGDMLVCLCPLTVRNWLPVGMRAGMRALRRKLASSS